MTLIKCSECGKSISDTSKKCIHCGNPVVKKIKCPECGKMMNESDSKCENCGFSPKKFELNAVNEKISEDLKDIKGIKNIDDAKNVLKKKNNIPLIVIIAVVVIVIICVVSGVFESGVTRVDVNMTSWYDDVESEIEKYGLEFYSVTSGANCYSGTKTNKFETEEYGILYTEFTYCKSSKVQRLRIYNLESDQKLK